MGRSGDSKGTLWDRTSVQFRALQALSSFNFQKSKRDITFIRNLKGLEVFLNLFGGFFQERIAEPAATATSVKDFVASYTGEPAVNPKRFAPTFRTP